MTVPMYKKHAMFMYWMCVLVQLSGYLTLKLQQNMQYSTEMYLGTYFQWAWVAQYYVTT